MITKYKEVQNYLTDYLELDNLPHEFKKTGGWRDYYNPDDLSINEQTSDIKLQEIIDKHRNVFHARDLENNGNYYRLRATDIPFCNQVEKMLSIANNYSYIRVTGFFYYPKNAYMGWHTNSNLKGNRTYLSWVDEDDKSFFRYLDVNTGEVVTKWEKKGWNENNFMVTDDNLYWHCVGSKCNRISLGFNVASSYKDL